MYHNDDFEAHATVTMTMVLARINGQSERELLRDIIKALQTYHNSLPDGAHQDRVKEIILV